jgi:hypothetical protein
MKNGDIVKITSSHRLIPDRFGILLYPYIFDGREKWYARKTDNPFFTKYPQHTVDSTKVFLLNPPIE